MVAAVILEGIVEVVHWHPVKLHYCIDRTLSLPDYPEVDLESYFHGHLLLCPFLFLVLLASSIDSNNKVLSLLLLNNEDKSRENKFSYRERERGSKLSTKRRLSRKTCSERSAPLHSDHSTSLFFCTLRSNYII